MSRIKISRNMIQYLKKKINCDDILIFIQENTQHNNLLSIESTKVSYDDIEYVKSNGDAFIQNLNWIKKVDDTFNIFTESNFLGFDYFPYLYGVIKCQGIEKNHMYVFYESFDESLDKLFIKISHVSEWYDIVFQIVLIYFCLEIINFRYYENGTPDKFLYRILPKPYYKTYLINNTEIKILHKHLIVFWNYPLLEIQSDNTPSCVSLLYKYIQDNKDKFNIPPSERILSFLSEIIKNPIETGNIIIKYFASK